MIHLNVVLTVKDPADVPYVRQTLAELGKLSKRDPGCIRFETYHSQADRRMFFLNEIWEDQASLDQHRKTKPFVEIYMAQVVPKLERAPHPCELIA